MNNVEQNLRAFRMETREEFGAVRNEMREDSVSVRSEMQDGFTLVRGEIAELRGEVGRMLEGQRLETNALRTEINARFDRFTRWHVGFVFATWLTVMASIWLKP